MRCRIFVAFPWLTGYWQSTSSLRIPGFGFAIEPAFGLDSDAPTLREPAVNPSRPFGPDQPNGPRHVHCMRFLRARTLGIAFGSIAFGALAAGSVVSATPARAMSL